MSGVTVARKVVETLRTMGVRHVFGVPSGGWVDYMEAIRQTDGIDFVLASHEGGAAFMAAVSGEITGVPGVCFGTFGPGATNLSTGVGCAFLDRSPVIALTDEIAAPMRGRITQMGIDHQALFRPITKATMRLRADRVEGTLRDAAEIALSGRRGPVHVGLPVGLSAEVAGVEQPKPVRILAAPAADERAVQEMVRLFEGARKPVIAVGRGAVSAGVRREIRALAERFDLPVVLTPMAKGMLREDHPLYAGVLFHALSDEVGKTHQQADLVLAVGYDPVEFNFEAWVPDAPLVNIDIEPVDVYVSRHKVGADVVGDIALTLEKLMVANRTVNDWDLGALAERKQAMFRRLATRLSDFGPVAALDILRDSLPQNGIMTCDVGAHTHLIGQKWRTPAPGLQIMTNGWSAMGFGIPSAIAAKICRPDLAVCSVVGDGGFLMTAGELAVAARERLKIVFVLFSDNDLALIRIKQERKQNPIYGTSVRAAGTVGGDNIFGVPVVKAGDCETFRAALTAAFDADGPVVVEALLDSVEYDDLVLHNDRL